jgi:glycosyltransferase involved in cell wall biosynthesis
LFIFPTLEDGFAVVLAQAAMSGLPILTTPNCAGTDLVKEGQTGFVLPIRSSASFVEKLQWCDMHRVELAAMVRRVASDFRPRDWSHVAADFERIICSQHKQVHETKPVLSHR